MITSARIDNTPPFTDTVEFVFDERVNLFIGPNASGKSNILRKLVRDYVRDPWVFIPSVRLNIPLSSKTPDWLTEMPDDLSSHDLDQILWRNVHPHIFDGKLVYRAAEIVKWRILNEQGDASKSDNALKVGDLSAKCAQDICRDVLIENAPRDYIQHVPRTDTKWLDALLFDHDDEEVESDTDAVGHHDEESESNTEPVVHYDMGVRTIDVKDRADDVLFVGDLSSGTQNTLLWIWHLALRIANFYDFADGWEEQPAVLLIDEIENHLHPTWQRRVIPALRKHFPGVQIFATTHSPFVVAGLKAGQVHLLERDENGVVSASTNEQDIIGWTVSEILRALMGVDDPTDEPTAINAARLRELRRKRASEGLSDAEDAEMRDLRKSVSGDTLAGGALNAQRDRLADTLQEFMQSRLAKTPQE